MLYTYRTQEKAADRYQQWEKWRKTTSIILTALTAGAFVASLGGLFFDPEVNTVLVSGAATLATMLTFLGESVDWKRSVEAHRAAAVDLRTIHNRYESLTWDIENDAISLENALVKRDELERDERNLLSPNYMPNAGAMVVNQDFCRSSRQYGQEWVPTLRNS